MTVSRKSAPKTEADKRRNNINPEMTYLKASFHNHTNSEKKDPVRYSERELIDHAAQKGFKILAITCHNQWTHSKELAAYAKEKGILLIPGTEQSIRMRHILILNAQKEAEKIRTFEALRKYKIAHPESFIIAAHPYFPGPNMFHDLIEKNIDCFDGIEFSWWYSKLINLNKRGGKLSEKCNLPFIGNSDTHIIGWFGKTHCEVEIDRLSTESVLEALRKGHFRNITKPIHTWEMLFLMPFIVIRDKLWLLKETVEKFAQKLLKH